MLAMCRNVAVVATDAAAAIVARGRDWAPNIAKTIKSILTTAPGKHPSPGVVSIELRVDPPSGEHPPLDPLAPALRELRPVFDSSFSIFQPK